MPEVFQEGTQPGDEGSNNDQTPTPDENTIDTNQVDGAQQRINQIYKRMKDSERDLQSERDALSQEREARTRLEERLRLVEEKPTTTQEPVLTERDLQAALDVGDGAAAAKIIAALAQQSSKENQTSADANAKRSTDRLRLQSQVAIAQRKVTEYLNLDPTIKDHTNPKWGEVEEAYLANKELGVPDDARAELFALDKVFGSPDKLKKAGMSSTQLNDQNFTETGAGGGFGQDRVRSTSDIVVQRDGINYVVPPRYTDYWAQRKMSREEMIKESKYLTPKQLERK